MCGIAGAFFPGSGFTEATLAANLRPVLDRLAHRGPDGDGIVADRARGLVLGHRRLAVADLSPAAAQPMWSPGRQWLVTFNGEVYNDRHLARELRRRPPDGGDTAVLATALEEWGWDRTLASLDGMFALAAWDAREERLYLVRDRFGEKPLAYAELGAGLIFASEVRALAAWPGFPMDIDPGARDRFVERGYLAAPECIYRRARKLEPGHTLVRGEKPRRYWSLPVPRPFAGTMADAVVELDYRLARAVDSRRAAAVPVGLFLSGGLDTTALAIAGRDLPAFTLGISDPAHDELPASRRTAQQLGLTHHFDVLDEATAVELVSQLAGVYDEPFADSSQIAALAASRMAARNVKAILCGDGGDELFGGYPRYRQLAAVQSLPPWVRRGTALALRYAGQREKAELLERAANARDLAALYAGVMGGTPPPLEAAFRPDDDPAAWMGIHDLHDYFPNDLLVKIDRAAMSCGLETRLPLLAPGVVELALSLPGAWKRNKRILARVIARRLPAFRPGPKKGFQIPIGRWLLGPLRDWAEFLVARTDSPELRRCWHDHLTRPQSRCVRLWSHLIWEDWIRQHAAGHPAPGPRSAPTVLPA